jgi:hypothetical protein
MGGSADTRILLRHIGLLAVIGMGVMFLSGPLIGLFAMILAFILAGFSILLPFVVLGLLVWLPFRLLCYGSHAAWDDVCRTGRALWWAAGAAPIRGCVRSCSGAGRLGKQVGERMRNVGRPRGRRLIETLCGAPVGALIGAGIGLQSSAPEVPILIGALVGAVLGYCVGAAKAQIDREATPDPAVEQFG